MSDEEVNNAINQITELYKIARCARRGDRRAHEQVETVQNMLADEFGRRHGWKRCSTWTALRKRWGQLCGGDARQCVPSDHITIYKAGEGYALVSHFYNFDHVYRPLCDAFAAKYPALTYEVIDDFPSWWNPGSSELVIWRERSAAHGTRATLRVIE